MSEHPPSADRPTGPGGSGHPEIDELASYVAGDIDVARLGALRAHVAGCSDCADDVRALEAVDAELAALTTPAMPADVAARLDAAIGQAGVPVGTTVLPATRGRRRSGWASGAAAAAVVVGLLAAVTIGSIAGNHSSKKNSATSAVPARTSSVQVISGAVYESNTDYTSANVAAQVKAVLQRAPVTTLGAAGAAAAGSEPAAASSAAPSAAAASSASASAPSVPFAAALTGSSAASAASVDTKAAASTAGSQAPPAPTAAATTAADSASSAPPPDLTALRNDPARLAQCVQSITGDETPPRTPLAYDFAAYEGKPALAIILPGLQPDHLDIWFVAGNCGEGGNEHSWHFSSIPVG
ncbi:MAG: hypothetical protein QOG49_1325 [Frankiaceae bacterium]|nr:hypothetical protein [Frankiaceae bacterium]